MRFTKYYRVSVDGVVRFESVYLEACQAFAQDVYRSENVIANIDEIRRDLWDL